MASVGLSDLYVKLNSVGKLKGGMDSTRPLNVPVVSGAKTLAEDPF